MTTEGNMLVFGDALSREHRLVLVVGREANNHIPIVSRIDEYTCNALATGNFPDVKFWSNAYGLMGRFVGIETHELKYKCIKERTSPIVFCDASPAALDGELTPYRKRKFRETIPVDVIEDHLQGVFSHSNVIDRTSLVVISGILGCGLDHAVPALQSACRSSGLPFCHIHGLSSRKHTHPQREQQLRQYAGVIRSTLSDSWGVQGQAA